MTALWDALQRIHQWVRHLPKPLYWILILWAILSTGFALLLALGVWRAGPRLMWWMNLVWLLVLLGSHIFYVVSHERGK